jgi:hypothetical protein
LLCRPSGLDPKFSLGCAHFISRPLYRTCHAVTRSPCLPDRDVAALLSIFVLRILRPHHHRCEVILAVGDLASPRPSSRVRSPRPESSCHAHGPRLHRHHHSMQNRQLSSTGKGTDGDIIQPLSSELPSPSPANTIFHVTLLMHFDNSLWMASSAV